MFLTTPGVVTSLGFFGGLKNAISRRKSHQVSVRNMKNFDFSSYIPDIFPIWLGLREDEIVKRIICSVMTNYICF